MSPSQVLTAFVLLAVYSMVLWPVAIVVAGVVVHKRLGRIEPIMAQWPMAVWGATTGFGVGAVLAGAGILPWLAAPVLGLLLGWSLWGWSLHYQRLYEKRRSR